MGFLDNTSITVDAVLTKKGRMILKDGAALNITGFTCSDTGIDYSLWNPDHPSGSAYYGSALENLPMLEASVHASHALRNRLISLPENTITVPALELGIPNTTSNTLTFEDGDSGGSQTVTVTLKGYANNTNNTTNGRNGKTDLVLYAITTAPQIFQFTNGIMDSELSGIHRDYVIDAGIQRAKVFRIPATTSIGGGQEWHLPMAPDTSLTEVGRQASVTVIEKLTGAFNSFNVINNVTVVNKTLLSTTPKG